MVEVSRAIGVGIDADQHPFRRGPPAMDIEPVEPFGMSIQFEETATPARGPDDPRHVHVVGLARLDQPARGMGQQGNMRMIHGAEDTLGLLVPGQVEPAVKSPDDQIQAAEPGVGQVEPAVLQNVHLDTLQHGDAELLRVQPVDLVDLGEQAVGLEPMGRGHAPGMFGEGEIVEPALPAVPADRQPPRRCRRYPRYRPA
jgi:hypothetical protein